MTIRGINQQRNDLLRGPIDLNSWAWSYNLNLIGKDKLPNRQMDWPVPIGTEPNPRRSWAWSYNINLIGRDTFYDGQGNAPDWDYLNRLPLGWLERQDWRQSWTWSYNLNLIGQDKLPFRNQIPVPPPVQWYQSQESSYNRNLIGQDKLPNRQQDWVNPQPVVWYRSWEVNLLQTTLSSAKTPFPLPSDFPNPQPVTWYRSQESWYNLNLIGQDKLPIRQQDWPNPQPVQWYRDWSQNLLQNTLTPAIVFPKNQYDWPNPIGYPSGAWNYSLEGYFVQVTAQTPFNQFDWPNPTPVTWYRSQESWYNLNLIGKDNLPFRQKDWPLPRPFGAEASRDNYVNLLENTLSVITRPFIQTDWPNPSTIQWYRDWSQNLASNLLPPFRQLSWPLTPDIRDYRSWEYKYILELIGQDKLPNRQQDWPLPYPVSWYQDYRVNLLQTTLFTTPVSRPFVQSDWPLPTLYPITPWNYGQESYLVQPGPPIPPIVIATGGRQVGWDEIERVERFSQAFLKDHNVPIPKFYNTNPFDPTIKARDAAVRLGRLGGIASGIARKK